MKLSNVKIQKYLAKATGDKRAVAMLLATGNPAYIKNVPACLLNTVKKEIKTIE